jgi:hypothetical protein
MPDKFIWHTFVKTYFFKMSIMRDNNGKITTVLRRYLAARRQEGFLEALSAPVRRADLEATLGRPKRTVAAWLKSLKDVGLLRYTPAANKLGGGTYQVNDRLANGLEDFLANVAGDESRAVAVAKVYDDPTALSLLRTIIDQGAQAGNTRAILRKLRDAGLIVVDPTSTSADRKTPDVLRLLQAISTNRTPAATR